MYYLTRKSSQSFYETDKIWDDIRKGPENSTCEKTSSVGSKLFSILKEGAAVIGMGFIAFSLSSLCEAMLSAIKARFKPTKPETEPANDEIYYVKTEYGEYVERDDWSYSSNTPHSPHEVKKEVPKGSRVESSPDFSWIDDATNKAFE